MGLFTDGFKELKKASEPIYKSPKSIQETIEIMAVAENGIFEVARNRYSKCYLFQDINYTTTNEDEQIDIFERYCKFLNSLDCNYKITVNNKNKNMTELREKVMFPKKGDGFDEYRQAYNDIIEEKILDGRQGIEQEVITDDVNNDIVFIVANKGFGKYKLLKEINGYEYQKHVIITNGEQFHSASLVKNCLMHGIYEYLRRNNILDQRKYLRLLIKKRGKKLPISSRIAFDFHIKLTTDEIEDILKKNYFYFVYRCRRESCRCY